MKNKFLALILAICLIIPCTLTFTACGETEHQHTYVDGVCSECGAIEGLQFEYISSSKTYRVLDGRAVTVTSLIIPDKYDDGKNGEHAVTSIYGSAFAFTNLESVVIPNSIISLESNAFSDCQNLTSITIPKSVKVIGKHAFDGCTSLAEVTILDGVTAIGDGAFANCTALENVVIPNSVTSLGDSAFQECTALKSVTIGSGVTTIGGWAFRGCTDLTTINIPDGVTRIGQYIFSTCTSLKTLTIPKSVTVIGFFAFAECGLENIYYQGSSAEWSSVEKGKYGKVHPDYEDDIAMPQQTVVTCNG